MKNIFVIIFIFNLTSNIYGQNCNKDSIGQKQGLCIYIIPSPNVEVICSFLDNKLHGSYIEKSLYSGNIKIETYYSLGVQNGIRREYDTSGNLLSEKTYINGILNGSVRYYLKGKLAMEEFYLNGQAHGRWKFYNKKGLIESFFDCQFGKCGNSTFLDKKGNITKKIIVGKDGLRKKTFFYNKKGEIIKEELH